MLLFVSLLYECNYELCLLQLPDLFNGIFFKRHGDMLCKKGALFDQGSSYER